MILLVIATHCRPPKFFLHPNIFDKSTPVLGVLPIIEFCILLVSVQWN